MKKNTKLLFGIHMHQPIDNFDEVIEQAVEVCYGPFFEVMSRYPEFQFAVHCSGWLMQEIQTKHPELYANIKKLSDAGSIEFFSAGFYEPILSAIPSKDRVKQIAMLSDFITENFQQTPQGLWLTERVWEASLIPDIAEAGIKYTLIDDYHFQCAGFDAEILDGYYMSEESGIEMGLFPISKKLRYALPFFNVESAIKAIKSYNREEDSAAIIFDDAEKFGMWPGTYEWVYKKEWLDGFIQAVLADDQIETMHFSSYYKQEKSRGIAYLPNLSYAEMGAWSLRADDTLQFERLKSQMGEELYEREGVKFLKGGTWKNFFVKYEESNRMHKRTIELSKARKNIHKKRFELALYKSQANDALWHGAFGGLYLPNLRDNVYNYIIEAENLRYGKKTLLISDQNELDGYDKVKIITPKYIFRFDSAHGGQMVEFDSREARFNWQNTLMRRKEAYHQRLLEDTPEAQEERPVEDGIESIHHANIEVTEAFRNALIYDWHGKNSFIDHFSDANFNGDNFKYANFHEFGDFANQPFETTLERKSVTFSRNGGLYFPEKTPTKLSKTYKPTKSGFDFEIDIESETERALHYILEHNFHFADYKRIEVNGLPLEDEGVIKEVKQLEIEDAHLHKKITLTLDMPFTLYYFQLKTLSQSEEGFELTTQGISFAMLMPFAKKLLLHGSLEIINV